MSALTFEIVLILLLILANGVFALAEIALVSARQARLQRRAEEGERGARIALELAAEPTRFLSTVQIGITLVGVLTGAFGGATLAEPLTAHFKTIPVLAPYSTALGIGLVVLAITYLSLVVGELLPKRLALHQPEPIAVFLAPSMRWLSLMASPVVRLLSASTEGLLRLLGIHIASEPPVTQEDLHGLLDQGTRVGVFVPTEQELVESALRLDDLRLSMLMTPRTAIVWLDLDDALGLIRDTILASPYDYFPAAHSSLDHVVGILRGRDVLACPESTAPEALQALVQKPLFVPETLTALDLLEMFKQSGHHMALVIDEFGGLQGLVTLIDMLEALIGHLREPGTVAEPSIIQREDGSWLLDGRLSRLEVCELLGISDVLDTTQGGYTTLGGFVMTMLGQIPISGQHFTHAGHRFEVIDMDGLRVDKVLVTPVPSAREVPDPHLL
ncbi:MAG: hemolysin family protein [Candidatus Tectimicrobiota bacterium]